MNFLELVPRDLDVLIDESQKALNTYPELTGINVPDVIRLENRSYDVVNTLLQKNIRSLPHIRAQDNTVDNALSLISPLVENGLKEILIVHGDAHEGLSKPDTPVTSLDLIKAVKERFPNLSVYGALDPYRSSLQDEIAYCHQKIAAGCDGFFTQPFFDMSLATTYTEKLRETTLFLGISPVLTERSKQYWITVNKAIFPSDFDLSLAQNTQLSKDIIALASSTKNHSYMMPIKAPLWEYLNVIFK